MQGFLFSSFSMGHFWQGNIYVMMINDETIPSGDHEIHSGSVAGGVAIVCARRDRCVLAGMAFDRDTLCPDVHCRIGDDEAEPGASAKAPKRKRRTA